MRASNAGSVRTGYKQEVQPIQEEESYEASRVQNSGDLESGSSQRISNTNNSSGLGDIFSATQ